MNQTAKKILFVEDEPIAQMAYRNRLQREGFETQFAEDGEIALNTLSQGRPDLVVLDLMLPKVNGTEVLKHIRSQERLKETPVLILSNAYVTELSQKAMESGATRGMLKTECTPAKLVETVRDMLGFTSAFDVSDKPVTDDSQAEAFIAAVHEAHADEMMLKETREDFVKKAPAEIAKIREYSLAYIKAGAASTGMDQLNNLFQQVRFFSTRAGLSGCVKIALLASAFEALLFEIVFKSAKATASMSQTVAQAVDCLERLCQKTDASGAGEPNLKARILVVDDDAVCNLAMVGALKRAHFEPASTEDPTKVIELLQNNQFDVVLLDVNMPVINGFELCKKLRSIPEYKEIPVIFITANCDFQSRAQGILSGGNDLIPKPVSPAELILKTTMRLLQPHGLWPETPAATARPAAKSTPPTNGSPQTTATPLDAPKLATPKAPAVNGHANGITPDFVEKLKIQAGNAAEPPKPAEKPVQAEANKEPAKGTPLAIPTDATDAPSISTEMIKRAWSHGPAEPPKPDKQGAHGDVKKDTAKMPPPRAHATNLANGLTPAFVEKLRMAHAESNTEHFKNTELQKQPATPADKSVEAEQKKAVEPEKPVQADAAKETAKAIVPEIPVAADVPATAPVETIKVAQPENPIEPSKAAQPEKPVEAEHKKAVEPEKAAPVEANKEVAKTAEPEIKSEPPKIKDELPKVEINPVPAEVPPAQPIESAKETIVQPLSETNNSNQSNNMETTTAKPTFDEAARGVARIIFGDENITEMNVRLTRIALESYNVPGTKSLDDVAKGVTRIIFGDANISDMNVRLTRIALERYNVAEVLGATNGSSKVENGAPLVPAI